MLVDFDTQTWTTGEARYPINVEKVEIWRSDGVSHRLLIKSDHDLAMLNHIFCREYFVHLGFSKIRSLICCMNVLLDRPTQSPATCRSLGFLGESKHQMSIT